MSLGSWELGAQHMAASTKLRGPSAEFEVFSGLSAANLKLLQPSSPPSLAQISLTLSPKKT